MKHAWRSHIPKIEELARKFGLQWSPVIFESVPDSFMTEIAVYGLPVRMPHWSFGARYIYQLVQRHMGYSRLFEVVFPGNPGHAYLASIKCCAVSATRSTCLLRRTRRMTHFAPALRRSTPASR